MKASEFLKRPGAWPSISMGAGTVVSSRVRLARNLRGSAFPGWAGEEECERIWTELSGVLAGLPSMQ